MRTPTIICQRLPTDAVIGASGFNSRSGLAKRAFSRDWGLMACSSQLQDFRQVGGYSLSLPGVPIR